MTYKHSVRPEFVNSVMIKIRELIRYFVKMTQMTIKLDLIECAEIHCCSTQLDLLRCLHCSSMWLDLPGTLG